MNEAAFELTGPDGLVRRGIVHTPAVPSGSAIVLLPSGFKHRVGSHRFNLLLARRLVAQGHLVLRYDPAGIGESDGTLSIVPPGTLSARLEEGYFADDALLAAAAVRERFGVTRVLLGGLCGGAITAQLAAARDRLGHVQGVIALGMPALTIGPPNARNVPQPQVARRRLRNYAQKLASPAAWARVFSGQSDYDHIGRNVLGALKRPQAAVEAPALPGTTAAGRPNPHFLGAFEALRQRGVPQLFVYGTADNRWIEFEETFLPTVLGGRLDGPGYAVRLVPEGSHELDFGPARRLSLEHVDTWLRQAFDAHPAR